jgi:hypothetical protein
MNVLDEQPIDHRVICDIRNICRALREFRASVNEANELGYIAGSGD